MKALENIVIDRDEGLAEAIRSQTEPAWHHEPVVGGT